MSNLKTFLNEASNAEKLNVKLIKALINEEARSEKDSFELSINLAIKLHESTEWYNSKDGKTQREVDGVEADMYTMCKEVFNLGKTQASNYRKVAKGMIDNKSILKEYCEFVKNEKKAGEDERYGLKGFMRYIKDEVAPSEDKVEILSRFTFGTGKDAIKVTADVDGNLNNFGNSSADIIATMEILLQQVKDSVINNAPTKPKAKK